MTRRRFTASRVLPNAVDAYAADVVVTTLRNVLDAAQAGAIDWTTLQLVVFTDRPSNLLVARVTVLGDVDEVE